MLFDFAALDSRFVYKLMVSTVVPRPIAWVVTQNREGRLNCAPFSFFNCMSGDPPILSLGIGNRDTGERKDSAANILATGQFVVNLVPFSQAAAMNVTAIEFPPEVDELSQTLLHTEPSVKVAPPRLRESPVAFECELLKEVEIAEGKAILLGRVLALHVRDDCVLDPQKGYIDTPRLDLIARMHGAHWYARTTDLFQLERIPLAQWKLSQDDANAAP